MGHLITYLDDLVLFSGSVKEMFILLECLLSKYSEFNLKLNPSKSFSFRSKVNYIGSEL